MAKRRILQIKAYRVPREPWRKFIERPFRASKLPPRDEHGRFRKRKRRGRKRARG